MAKCIACGKKGLFLKVNANGRCNECEEKLNKEIGSLNGRIQKIKDDEENLRNYLNEINSFLANYSKEKVDIIYNQKNDKF